MVKAQIISENNHQLLELKSIHSRSQQVHKQFLSRNYFLVLVNLPSLSCHSSLSLSRSLSPLLLVEGVLKTEPNRASAMPTFLVLVFCNVHGIRPTSVDLACYKAKCYWVRRPIALPKRLSTRAPTGAILQRTDTLETMTGLSKFYEISCCPRNKQR
jgi:hypothetical protein